MASKATASDVTRAWKASQRDYDYTVGSAANWIAASTRKNMATYTHHALRHACAATNEKTRKQMRTLIRSMVKIPS